MKTILTLLFVLICSYALPLSAMDTEKVTLGDTELALPIPDGYKKLPMEIVEGDERLHFGPERIKDLVGLYMPEEDVSEYMAGRKPELTSLITVISPEFFRKKKYSEAYFEQVMGAHKKMLGTPKMAEEAKKMLKSSGTAASDKEIIFESYPADSITNYSVRNTTYAKYFNPKTLKQVEESSSSLAMIINGKFLFVTFVKFSKDLELVSSATAKYEEDTLQLANK